MDSNTKTMFEITPFGVNKQTEKTHIVLKLRIHTNYESVIKSKVTTLHQNSDGVFFLMGDTGDDSKTKEIYKNYPNVEYNNPRSCFVWSFNDDVSKDEIYNFVKSTGRKFADLTFDRSKYTTHDNKVIPKGSVFCMEEQNIPSFFSVGLRQRYNRANYTQLMSEI